MTITVEKIEELRAVVNFWKYRVDEARRHLEKLVARETALPDNVRGYMATLIELKARELTESQRGLRKSQAGLGRALEVSGLEEPLLEMDSPRETDPLPEVRSMPRSVLPAAAKRSDHGSGRAIANGLAAFPMSDMKLVHRPGV